MVAKKDGLMCVQYINLRRGSYIVAFVGAWALTPWNILASAFALLNFMDGYTIWVSDSLILTKS